MTKPLDIDVENHGRWFRIYCSHIGCNNYTRMKLVDSSMGYFHNEKFGTVDLRNQTFNCDNHEVHGEDRNICDKYEGD